MLYLTHESEKEQGRVYGQRVPRASREEGQGVIQTLPKAQEKL